MTETNPTVSIGLPVFNGGEYLEESVSSILAQTYTNIELIISDNASTDRTQEICQNFVEQDPRVRYFRNESNIGGANNHNRTFELSRGSYFRWAAHDDICAPELIEKCVDVLERDPTVVLCYSEVINIDKDGNQTGVTSRNNGASVKPYERFATIASSRDYNEESYGLIRSEFIGKTQMLQNYTDSDRTFMCELGLYGKFHELPEPLFYKRFHPGNVYQDWRTRMAWFNPNIGGRVVFPFWIQFVDYLRVIKRVPVSRYTKFRCYLYMGKWLLLNGSKMLKDILYALYMLLHTSEWRKKRYENTDNWS